MGNYTAAEYIEVFGGLPDPCDPDVVHDPDAIRDRLKEEALEGDAAGGPSVHGSRSNDHTHGRTAPHSKHVYAGRSHCEVCGAPADAGCAPSCEANRA